MTITRRRNLLFGLTGAMAFAAAVAIQPARAEVPESSDPIKIGIYEWTGQHVTAFVAGHILEKMGYTVEYTTAAVLPSAVAIADGTLTVGMELWDNNLGDYFPKLIADGEVEDIGEVGIDAREGWLYPKFVEEMCPGMPAWDAFIGCAGIFASPETLPNGRFVEYPADWSDRASQLIMAEGLPFEPVPAGSEGALIAEFKSAVEKKQPLVMMFWAPHWMLSTVEYGWVDMPVDLVNKASMQKPRVFNTAWPAMKDKWPAAYKFLKLYKIDNATQEVMMDLIDNQGQDVQEVTRTWVEEHEDVWKPWVEQAMM